MFEYDITKIILRLKFSILIETEFIKIDSNF